MICIIINDVNFLFLLTLKVWCPHVLLTEKETLCTKCGLSVVYCAVTLGGQGQGGPRLGWGENILLLEIPLKKGFQQNSFFT